MKRGIFIFLLLFLSFLPSVAQIQMEMDKINVDSLQHILPSLKGTERIDALNRLAFGLCRKHPDSSIAIGNRSVLLSEKIDYQGGKADGLFNIGNGYFFMDSIKPMVLNYLAALAIYENLEQSVQMGMTLYQLALVNRLTGRYENAKTYIKRAIKIYHNMGNPLKEADALHILSAVFRESNERDSSLYYLDKALDILDKHPDYFLLGSIYNDYGLALASPFWKGDKKIEYLLEGIPWFFKCWELDTLYNHPAADMATPIYNIGSHYIATGSEENIKKGLEYLMLAKCIIDTVPTDCHLTVMVHRRLSQVEKRKGNYEKAIGLLKQGINEAQRKLEEFSVKNYHDTQFAYVDKYYTRLYLSYAYSDLYGIYTQLANYEQALGYYILKEKATDEIFQEDNRRLIAMLEADSENEKTVKKIAILARDNELKEMKVTQSRIFNLAIAILFVILVLLGFLFLRQNKLKNEHKSTLLEQKLLRLQMNPHFIFNAFSNILRFIDNNENNKASNYLTTFSKLLRTTLESTREDLIPFEKELGTLRNYLELQKLRYPDKFEYSVEVDETIDQENMSIPPMLVQPFIENSIEH